MMRSYTGGLPRCALSCVAAVTLMLGCNPEIRGGAGGNTSSGNGGQTTTVNGSSNVASSNANSGSVNGSTASSSDASTSLAAAGGADGFMGQYPDPLCDVSETGTASPATLDEYKDLLVGRWMRCEGSSFFGGDYPGFEIVGDGNWYKLEESSPGTFERELTLGDHGTWEALVNGPGEYQLTLHVPGVGDNFFSVAFSLTPRKMQVACMCGNSQYVFHP
jgi:hypothetical protein